MVGRPAAVPSIVTVSHGEPSSTEIPWRHVTCVDSDRTAAFDITMGPQPRLMSHRFSIGADLDTVSGMKERQMMSGSGSPGRLQDNISRDSGIGCLKVTITIVS